MKTILKKVLFVSLFFSANIELLSAAVESDVEKEEARKEKLDADFKLAIESGSTYETEQALKKGSDVNNPNIIFYGHIAPAIYGHGAGHTALMEAAKNGYLEVVELLVAHKAVINWQSGTGCTALMYALEDGHEKIVKSLLAYRAAVNLSDKYGRTALGHAACNGYPKLVKLLLKNKADINQQERNGSTVLMGVILPHRLDVVRELLAAKEINVNQQGKNGNTALARAQEGIEYADRNRDAEDQKQIRDITILLLEKGANPLIKNKRGKTVLDEEDDEEGNEIGKIIEKFKQKERKKTSELLETELSFLPSVLAALIAEFNGTPIDLIEDL